MRTAYRALSTAVAVGAIFPIGLPSASAGVTEEIKVETAAWFWSAQQSGFLPAGGLQKPQVPAQLSGVDPGQLAVAYKGDNKTDAEGNRTAVPDKETYLAWDIYDVPQDSVVDSFVFTMFLDPDEKQLYATETDNPTGGKRGGPPAIVACLPKIGFGEAEGDSFDAKPEDNCADQIFGSYDEKTLSYTFDATTYAQDWVDGKDNFGLGIRPTEDATEPFQLIFKGADSVKATIAYTPPEPEQPLPPMPTVDPVAPLPPAPDVSVFVPPAPQPAPQPQPQPSAAPPPVVVQSRAPVVVNNVAARPLTPSRALTPLFWFAMLGGVVLLGAMSLILGDPVQPAAGGTTRVRTGGRHLAPVGATTRSSGAVRTRTV